MWILDVTPKSADLTFKSVDSLKCPLMLACHTLVAGFLRWVLTYRKIEKIESLVCTQQHPPRTHTHPPL